MSPLSHVLYGSWKQFIEKSGAKCLHTPNAGQDTCRVSAYPGPWSRLLTLARTLAWYLQSTRRVLAYLWKTLHLARLRLIQANNVTYFVDRRVIGGTQCWAEVIEMRIERRSPQRLLLHRQLQLVLLLSQLQRLHPLQLWSELLWEKLPPNRLPQRLQVSSVIATDKFLWIFHAINS